MEDGSERGYSKRVGFGGATSSVGSVVQAHGEGTDLRTEAMVRVTVFMSVSYIIFVNLSILANAEIPQQAAFGAIIYASALASILIGLWANFPVALAPGLGLNTFFKERLTSKMRAA